MYKRCLLLFLLVLLFSTASLPQLLADDTVASNYLHLRNNLGTTPGTVTDLANDQNSPPQTARYYEFSGQIVGQVSSNDQPIVLIQTGNISAEVAASQTFLASTDWMSSGNIIRALVKSVPDTTSSGSPEALVLIAAGPETSISSLEKKLASDQARASQAMERRHQQLRSSYEVSRSAYAPQRYVQNTDPVAGLSPQASAIFPAYHDRISQLNPHLSEDEVTKITTSILYYADLYQLDPRLIVAMVTAESGFDPDSVSRTGAMGLGQLMPSTASELGVTDAFDPQQNIAAAVHILSGHVQQYGGAEPYGVVPVRTLLLTMAAYNAGTGAVKKYGGVPPFHETQNYVRKVNAIYRQLCGG